MKFFLYLSIFLCVTTPMAAFCADLRLIDPDQNIMDCDFLLEGEIDENTHHEFAQLLQLWVLNDADERVSNYLSREGSARLCLNSLGGSYLGGIELADQILKQRIATAVSKGSVCESACALAFMAGSVHYAEAEQPQVDRKLHPEARLGFHAPGLKIPDGAYQKEQVETAYDIALSAVVKLIGLRSESFFQMPESLIKKMLSTPASQMYYIETVQEAVRYGIHVPHTKFLDTSVKLIGSNICQNAGAFLTDREMPALPLNTENVVIDGRDIRVHGIRYGSMEDSCRPWCKQDYCSTTWSLTEETFFISKSLIATYPPETPLRDLSQEPSITFAEYEKRLKLALGLLVQGKNCFINSSEATITNVQNFTNLRRKAGLKGPVISQVPLGATVSVVNQGQFLRSDRCAATCNGTNQNAIKQCIDNNDVWIEVRYNGRGGFLSRKFLEVAPAFSNEVETSQQKTGVKLTRCFDSRRKEVYSTSGGATCDTNDRTIWDSTYKTFLSMGFKIRNTALSRVDISSMTCAFKNTSGSITNVQNFTNLRRKAGLKGPVISQVPLGATVSVVNQGQFLRSDRCAATCNGTNQNAIKQCIDNNDVWIEVDYNGRRGFLSRKFLEVAPAFSNDVETSQQKTGVKLTRCFDSTRKEVYSTSGGATCDASDKILGDSTYKAFLNMGYKVRN